MGAVVRGQFGFLPRLSSSAAAVSWPEFPFHVVCRADRCAARRTEHVALGCRARLAWSHFSEARRGPARCGDGVCRARSFNFFETRAPLPKTASLLRGGSSATRK